MVKTLYYYAPRDKRQRDCDTGRRLRQRVPIQITARGYNIPILL